MSTPIPLPTGLSGGKRTPKQVEVIRNAYVLNDQVPTIRTRPVAKSVGSSLGRCRGMGLFRDELYMVSNDRLVKITLTDPLLAPLNNLTITDLGEVTGEAECQLEAGYTELCIIVRGGAGYVYNDTDGFREITDPSYKPSVYMAYDQGRFVFVPSTGDPFFWSLLQDPANILAINFADAEEFPDLNKTVFYRRKQIYVGGGRSFERIGYNSTIDTYASIEGASSAVGFIGGKTNYNETFLFIGVGENGGFSIYTMTEKAQKISSPAVDEILGEYTAVELKDCTAGSFMWEGVEFALFYLPNETLCFYGDWAKWHSDTKETTTWSVQYFQFCYGYIFTGDRTLPTIGIITDGEKEYEKDVDAGFTTFIKTGPRNGSMINKVFASINPGESGNESSMGLAVSRDGVIYGPTVYKSIGITGDYAQEMSWGPTIMKINDFIGLEFSWRGDMQLTCDGVSFE